MTIRVHFEEIVSWFHVPCSLPYSLLAEESVLFLYPLLSHSTSVSPCEKEKHLVSASVFSLEIRSSPRVFYFFILLSKPSSLQFFSQMKYTRFLVEHISEQRFMSSLLK